MQHPTASHLPAEFSDIGSGSSSLAQPGQITKEGIQGQNSPVVQHAEIASGATAFLEMLHIDGQPLGYGNGFFVKRDQIATNFHVIAGASRGTVSLVGKPTTYVIEGITASDVENDLAILKVSDTDIQPLPIGDSEAVQLGDIVYACGHSEESADMFSDGIISGTREVGSQKLLQMTAPISPRGSGGAVLNEKGEVIGISFVALEDGQPLNFAIPSNHLKALISKSEAVVPLSEEKQLVSAETYFHRGNEAYLMKLYQDAIVAYDEAIRLQPDFANAYVNRGLAKEKLGQHESAIMDYQ